MRASACSAGRTDSGAPAARAPNQRGSFDGVATRLQLVDPFDLRAAHLAEGARETLQLKGLPGAGVHGDGGEIGEEAGEGLTGKSRPGEGVDGVAVEDVAEDDGDAAGLGGGKVRLLLEPPVEGGAVPPAIRAVDDVVVDEDKGVKGFEGVGEGLHRRGRRLSPGKDPVGPEEESRPDPFAPRFELLGEEGAEAGRPVPMGGHPRGEFFPPDGGVLALGFEIPCQPLREH